jgi:hypothetical protein
MESAHAERNQHEHTCLENRRTDNCSYCGTVGKTCGCDHQCHANISRARSQAKRPANSDRSTPSIQPAAK